jgi:hypothetical protein
MLAATPGAGFWLNLRQREAWRPVRIGGLVATLPDRFLAIPGASRPPTQLTREHRPRPSCLRVTNLGHVVTANITFEGN